MNTDKTLYIKKISDGAKVKSSFDSFGFAAMPIPWPSLEIKDYAKRDWPSEHGEDIYFPKSGAVLKPFELTIEFVCNSTELTKFCAFRDYLFGFDTSGSEMEIYDPYCKVGYKGVYVKKCDKPDIYCHDGISVKITFAVSRPNEKTELAYVAD